MLQIAMMGKVEICEDGLPFTQFRSQKEKALLLYLTHVGGVCDREAVADLLWEARTTKQSLSNLRTALARLRKQTGESLLVTRKTVAVVDEISVSSDSIVFQTLISGIGDTYSEKNYKQLAEAMALYKGELMAGFYLPDAPRFNDWLVIEREQLHQLAMINFQRLADWQEKVGAFESAVLTAQRWASFDLLDEIPHQYIMRLLAYSGQKAKALAEFEKLSTILQAEFDASPTADTLALYEAIASDTLEIPDTNNSVSEKQIRPHNLSNNFVPLIGRETELATVANYLDDPTCSLVAITGIGGVGKTSLALGSARHCLANEKIFSDGIWFVSLAEIETESADSVKQRVASIIAQTMGLSFHTDKDHWTQLLGQLTDMDCLLILDNVEQFVEIAAEMSMALLEAGAKIKILLTSRRSLPLRNSKVVSLEGLQVPQSDLADAATNESMRLFADRVSALPITFDVADHLAEIVSICQFLKGLPLGIELAAASLSRLTIAEILQALSQNLAALDQTETDLPPRQRTLKAVFETSWQLLDAREQLLLAQISVFRGGFTREAATAVLAGEDAGLYYLQHHALLTRAGNGRFRLHPLIRQFAMAKLQDPSRATVADQIQHQHSNYYCEFIHSFEHELVCESGREAIKAILPEQANLQTAWRHATKTAQWDLIDLSLTATHNINDRQGLFAEFTLLLDEVIVEVEKSATQSNQPATHLLAKLLLEKVWALQFPGKYIEAEVVANRAIYLSNELQDAEIEAAARIKLGVTLSSQNRHEKAKEQYDQALTLAQQANAPFLEADALIGIGARILYLADFRPAEEPLTKAHILCEKLQYKRGQIEVLHYLGTLAHAKDDSTTFLSLNKQIVVLSQLIGHVIAEAEGLGSIGVSLKAQGELFASQSYQADALAKFRQLNMPDSEQWLLGELGHTALNLGDYVLAEKRYMEAIAIAVALNDDFFKSWWGVQLGMMWRERGDFEQAEQLMSEALQVSEELDNSMLRLRSLYEWGNVLLSKHDWVGAEKKYEAVAHANEQVEQMETAVPALTGLAYCALQQGKYKQAADLAEKVWTLWQANEALVERSDLKLFWRISSVMEALDDKRAQEIHTKAKELIRMKSERIPDDTIRTMFLEQIPVHRLIMQKTAQLA